MLVVPDPTTAVMDPFTALPTLSLICNIVDPLTKEDYSRDPRNIARKAEAYLKSTGIGDVAYFGPEPEFFVFDEVRYEQNQHTGFYLIDSAEGQWNTAREVDTLNDRGGRMIQSKNLGYKPRYKEGYFPVQPTDTFQDIRTEMVRELEKLGYRVEKHHHEVATAGQAEIDLRFLSLVKMGDALMWYKHIVKNVARRYGKTATFMPKPIFADNGSGRNTHQSIWKGERPLFPGDRYGGLSELAMHYIGGVLKHAPALAAFTCPTTNSYHRLRPGCEAQTTRASRSRNRSAAVRIPMYSPSPKAKRIEVRFPDPACNGYIAFSAMLMAGLDGVERRLNPGDPLDKDIYALTPEELRDVPKMPGSLDEALENLKRDHDFLLKGDVFTEDVIETWIEWKMANEVSALRLRPPAEKPALAQFASPQFTPLLAGPSITGPESLPESRLAVWPPGGPVRYTARRTAGPRHEGNSRSARQVRRHARDLRRHLPRVRGRVSGRPDRPPGRALSVRGRQPGLPEPARPAAGAAAGHVAPAPAPAGVDREGVPGGGGGRRVRRAGGRQRPPLQAPPALQRGRAHHGVRSYAGGLVRSGAARRGAARDLLPHPGLPARARGDVGAVGGDPWPQLARLPALVPGRDGHQAGRHLRQRVALADPAARPGDRPRLRLPREHVLHRPLLRHRHAEHDGPRRLAPVRHHPLDAPAGRVHDRPRRRAGARRGRHPHRYPSPPAVREGHHPEAVVRRVGGCHVAAARRGHALRRPHPHSARLVPRVASPATRRARPPLRRERDRLGQRVLRPAPLLAARPLARRGGSDHHHPHVLRQREFARDPERARERGALRRGGDDLLDLHRALGLRRGRTRARPRLAARHESPRRARRPDPPPP